MGVVLQARQRMGPATDGGAWKGSGRIPALWLFARLQAMRGLTFRHRPYSTCMHRRARGRPFLIMESANGSNLENHLLGPAATDAARRRRHDHATLGPGRAQAASRSPPCSPRLKAGQRILLARKGTVPKSRFGPAKLLSARRRRRNDPSPGAVLGSVGLQCRRSRRRAKPSTFGPGADIWAARMHLVLATHRRIRRSQALGWISTP